MHTITQNAEGFRVDRGANTERKSAIDESSHDKASNKNSSLKKPSLKKESPATNQESSQTSEDAPSTSRLASFLRIAGAGAVILSAVIYMLQGVETVDLNIRNWIYLILMSVMAAGAYVCRFKFSDALGARVFFTLAVLLIPVQFSQLGGMLYTLLQDHSTSVLQDVWNFNHVEQWQVMLSAGLSYILAISLSFMSFAILARSHTKSLVGIFIVFNTMLLLPIRLGLPGLGLVLVMLGLFVWSSVKIFKAHSIFKTREALFLKCILALPIVIACTRAGFHVDVLTGFCITSILTAFAISMLLPACFENKKFKESSLFVGVAIASVSWICLILESQVWDIEALGLTLLILPIIALTFAARQRTITHEAGYSNMASLLSLLLAALLTLVEPSLLGGCVNIALALLLAAWGAFMKERLPLLAAILLAITGIATVLILSLASVTVNIWLSLAIAGVVLVLCSSLVEKYGKRAFQQAKHLWHLS